MKYERPEIGFFTALIGLFTSPTDTMHGLLKDGQPRKGVLFLLLLFLVVFTPPVLLYWTKNELMYKPEIIVCLILLLLLTLVSFIIIEKFLLGIIGVRIDIVTLTNISCYCLASLSVAILLVYGMNYWASDGQLRYLTFIPQGFARTEDKFAGYIGYVLNMGVVAMGLQFAIGIRIAGDMLRTNAFFITILSIVPLFTAFIIGMLVAEQIYPGFIELMRGIYVSPSAVMA